MCKFKIDKIIYSKPLVMGVWCILKAILPRTDDQIFDLNKQTQRI